MATDVRALEVDRYVGFDALETVLLRVREFADLEAFAQVDAEKLMLDESVELESRLWPDDPGDGPFHHETVEARLAGARSSGVAARVFMFLASDHGREWLLDQADTYSRRAEEQTATVGALIGGDGDRAA